MFCYNCGCQLSEHDFCTACGADVSVYKKIMHISNMFYNDGLEKAGVRDLSGAINSLRQSLKFNKNNIEARNLLGLVYFETGEVVAALSEWVISKNLRAEKNIADTYINMIQSNATRLDSINQTIKKYNQSLAYCHQDSKDLAIIQLKKVLSLNPKFIRAHLLLALLYIDSEQWERAQRELQKVLAMDCNNTAALRYMKETQLMLTPEDPQKHPAKQKKEESVRYQSDNEIIIQPLNIKEPKRGGSVSFVNIIIGLAIGAAAVYFLAVPAAQNAARVEANKSVVEMGNQLDAKTAQLNEVEDTLKALRSENETLKADLEGYVGTDGAIETMDEVFRTVTEYLNEGDLEKTAAGLESLAESVDMETTSDTFRALYDALFAKVAPALAQQSYKDGYAAYTSNDFATAIGFLEKTVQYDETNGDALYYLAQSYRRNNEKEKAIEAYDRVIQLFPDTTIAANAQKRRDDLSR